MPAPLTSWGLDVGTTSIKAIKLRREADSVVVEAFDVVEHDKLLTEAGNRDEVIRATIGKFLERNPIRNEGVFIGVPGNATFSRFVKLPPVEPKKVPEIVRFEAIQQVPFPLDQVNWDYQTFTSPDTPEVEVGIFAMKKDLVAQFMANFQSHAMIVEGVQMAPLAVYNAVMYDGLTAGKGTVVVDIGAEHTDLIFCDAGRVWLRTINIGGNAFTDALSKSFKISSSKAETLKRTAATSKHAKEIFQAMRPVYADLVSEVQRSIGFYNSSHRDSNLERLVGMGNPFKLPHLAKYIQQELKMEVVRLETFKKAVAEGKLGIGLNEHILGMPAAYGLALQGLELAAIDTSLLPPELARQMLWHNKQRWFAAAAAMIAVGIGAIAFQTWNSSRAFASASGDNSPVRNQNDQIIRQANSASSAFSAVSDAQYTKSLDEIKQIQDLASDRRLWPELYVDLTKALPQAGDSKSAPVVVQSIDSRYTSNVTGVALTGGAGGQPPGMPDIAALQAYIAQAQGAAAAGGGPPNMSGIGQFMPGGAGGAGPNAANTKPGFQITITGYVPSADGRDVVKNFVTRLKEQLGTDKAKGDKPYYLDPDTTYDGHWIGAEDFTWGKDVGPFFRLIAGPALGMSQADIDKIDPPPQQTGGGAIGLGNLNTPAPTAAARAVPRGNQPYAGGPPPGMAEAIARMQAEAAMRGAGPPGYNPGPMMNPQARHLTGAESAALNIDPFTKKPVGRYYSFTIPLKVYLKRGGNVADAKSSTK